MSRTNIGGRIPRANLSREIAKTNDAATRQPSKQEEPPPADEPKRPRVVPAAVVPAATAAAIYAQHLNGQPIDDLARAWGLRPAEVQSVIDGERLAREERIG